MRQLATWYQNDTKINNYRYGLYTELDTFKKSVCSQAYFVSEKNTYIPLYVENLPSHIQDTTDYLRKMESMNPLPPETLLVTLDITSLYTNIPHDGGIQSCREIWDSRNTLEPPAECLVQLLTLVLKCNNFTFNGENYLLINGTAMGTKMAPSYANVFMGKLERQIISTSLFKPLSWFRFIDDVDMEWIESQQKLNAFIRHANNTHQ